MILCKGLLKTNEILGHKWPYKNEFIDLKNIKISKKSTILTPKESKSRFGFLSNIEEPLVTLIFGIIFFSLYKS
jgi:hypothetical protein